jgi:hypothetical protein
MNDWSELVAALTWLPYGRDNEDPRRRASMTNDQQGTAVSPEVHVAAYTDPEEYAFEAIKLAAGANVLGFGSAIGKSFRARLARVSLDRLSIGLGRSSSSLTLSSGVPNAHVFMFATEPLRRAPDLRLDCRPPAYFSSAAQ